MFRGREQSRPELGYRLLQRLAEDVGELGFVESSPKQDGRNMIMVLGPTKKKAEAKAEQRRKRDEDASGTPAAAAAATGRTRRERPDAPAAADGRTLPPPPRRPRSNTAACGTQTQSHHRTTEGDRPPCRR